MTRTLDTLTIGEFRRLMHYGGADTDTLAHALDGMAAGDRVQAAHETVHTAYQAYVTRREDRRGAAIEAAALKASRSTSGGDGAKMAARQDARLETYAAFEAREPLLGFAEWQDAGEPETPAVSVAKRAATKVRELVS